MSLTLFVSQLVADEEAPPPECEPIPELAAPAPIEQLVQVAAEHVGNPFVPQSNSPLPKVQLVLQQLLLLQSSV